MIGLRKTVFLILMMMIVSGVTLAGNHQSALILEIPASIVVPGPGLRLGDLGTIHGGTPADREDLMSVSLGSAPLPGQVRTFNRSYLMQIIQQHQFRKEVVLQMGEQVEVRVAAVCIGARDFETVIANILPPKKPGIIKRWIEIRNLPPEIWVEKDAQWKLEASVMGNFPEAGTVLFKLTLSGLGAHNRIFNISGKLHQTALLYRAVRDIPRKEKLERVDFEAVETELVNGREYTGEITGKIRATKLIRRGEILRTEFFETVPLVHKDHEVQVIVKGNSIEIRTFGTAKKDGWLGDEIQVVNRSSKKIFRARVIGEEMVEVILR